MNTDTVPWPTDEELGEHDAELAAVQRAQAFSAAVDDRVRLLHVQDRARERYEADKAAKTIVPPFDAGTLRDILARPEPPPARVDQLIPWDAGTLIVAQRKTGKTTTILNLARALIEGSDFLGRFPTRAIAGSVGILNYEVSAHQLAVWAREHDLNGDCVYLANLRGRRNPLAHPGDRRLLAAQLREHQVETLIVDPFGRAYTGKSQNDPGEVGAWLAELDQFARGEVGAKDVVLAAHAGWNGERTRGSTALEDWADSVINLTRSSEDPNLRYLRAEGRDVLVEEDELAFDHASRTLTMAGTGSRKTATKVKRLEALTLPVLELLRAAEPSTMSGYAIDNALKKLISAGDLDVTHSKGDGAKAANLLERRQLVRSEAGGRGATLYSAITSLTSPTSPHLPTGNSGDLPHLPLRGEVAQGGHQPHQLPKPQGGQS